MAVVSQSAEETQMGYRKTKEKSAVKFVRMLQRCDREIDQSKAGRLAFQKGGSRPCMQKSKLWYEHIQETYIQSWDTNPKLAVKASAIREIDNAGAADRRGNSSFSTAFSSPKCPKQAQPST